MPHEPISVPICTNVGAMADCVHGGTWAKSLISRLRRSGHNTPYRRPHYCVHYSDDLGSFSIFF